MLFRAPSDVFAGSQDFCFDALALGHFGLDGSLRFGLLLRALRVPGLPFELLLLQGLLRLLLRRLLGFQRIDHFGAFGRLLAQPRLQISAHLLERLFDFLAFAELSLQ